MAIDPARQFAGPYVFNANNPVNLYDPDGRRTAGAPELWQILDYINELNRQMREASMRDMDGGGQGADNRDLWADNKEPLRKYIKEEIEETISNALGLPDNYFENYTITIEKNYLGNDVMRLIKTDKELDKDIITIEFGTYDFGKTSIKKETENYFLPGLIGAGVARVLIGLGLRSMFSTPIGVLFGLGTQLATTHVNTTLSKNEAYTPSGHIISISHFFMNCRGQTNTITHYYCNQNRQFLNSFSTSIAFTYNW